MELLRDLLALANGDAQKAAHMIAELMEQQEDDVDSDPLEGDCRIIFLLNIIKTSAL